MSGHRKRTQSDRTRESPWFCDPEPEREERRSNNGSRAHGASSKASRRPSSQRDHRSSHGHSRTSRRSPPPPRSPLTPSGPRGWSNRPNGREASSRTHRVDPDEVEDGEIPTVLEYSDRPRSPPRAPRADREAKRAAPLPLDRRASATASCVTSKDESKKDVEMSGTNASRSPTPVEKAELTAEQILAAARARRLAILAKHANATPSATTPQSVGSPLPIPSGDNNSGSVTKGLTTPTANLRIASEQLANSGPASEKGTDSAGGSPAPVMDQAFDLAEDEEFKAGKLQDLTNGDQNVSAADYNPDDDRRVDDERQLKKNGPGGPGAMGVLAQAELEKMTDALQSADPNLEQEGDDFTDDDGDDDDDMFATGPRKAKKRLRMTAPQTTFIPVIDRAGDIGTSLVADNFDDADGYYRFLLGELLDTGRYHVHANLGRGMFASVVRARDTQSKEGDEEVAIKVIRSQESMFKAGQKEATILRKLQDADPLAKYHVVRLQRTFEHRGHLCLVFESMSLNLREVVKRFGKDVGINLRAVRAYAHQILLGLSLMKKCNIMHADLKPDNILVNETKAVLKICDLGSASDVSENDITPYLVSRFYRAPEIILGLPYDFAIDMWSVGCTLYELYTGKILFPGRSNNHLLLLIMELKGKVNAKTLKKAKFADANFDEAGNFLSVEKNKVTGADTIKAINISSKPTHGLPAKLLPLSVTKKMQGVDLKLLTSFVDLLDKMLALDPAKRITPKEALNHPFIRQ